MWDTRDAEPLTAWLRAHPGIEVVCRDGSQTYRNAITAGAPDAVQVSDRFHPVAGARPQGLRGGRGPPPLPARTRHRHTGDPRTGRAERRPRAPPPHRGARTAGTGDGATRHRPPSRAGPQRGATLRSRADLAAGRADLAQAHRHYRPVPELPASPLGRGAAQHRRPAPRDRRAGLLGQRGNGPPLRDRSSRGPGPGSSPARSGAQPLRGLPTADDPSGTSRRRSTRLPQEPARALPGAEDCARTHRHLRRRLRLAEHQTPRQLDLPGPPRRHSPTGQLHERTAQRPRHRPGRPRHQRRRRTVRQHRPG
ncbi:transposase [Streptomyces yerevanensis]|uniref:transposase n=1 Tax=Streptomyces yerevanensis TaxID=66378 RepID=UPI003CCBE224